MKLPRFARPTHVMMSGSFAIYMRDPFSGVDRCVGYWDSSTGNVHLVPAKEAK